LIIRFRSFFLLLLPIISGAAVSFSDHQLFLSDSILDKETSISFTLSKEISEYSQNHSTPTSGSISLRIAPDKGVESAIELPIIRQFVQDTLSYDIGNTRFSQTTKRNHSATFQSTWGHCIKIPTSISSNKYPFQRNKREQLFSISPRFGTVLGNQSTVIQTDIIFQPEIFAHPKEPVLLHGTTILKFITFDRVKPMILFSISVPSNELKSSNIKEKISSQIIPSLLFRVTNNFNCRIDGIFVFEDNQYFEQKNTISKPVHFSAGIAFDFHTIANQFKSKKCKTGTETILNEVTLPLFNHLEAPIHEDTDFDGIPNEFDVCVHAKELFDGIDDFDGCPETLQTKKITGIDSTNILKNINYEPGTTVLNIKSTEALATTVNQLLQNETLAIELIGYTDNSGDYDENMHITSLRLSAIKDYLMQQGISETRIAIQVCGPNSPIADNSTRSGRDSNRRIEFQIKPSK